jgi:uncharacterized protein DUF4177
MLKTKTCLLVLVATMVFLLTAGGMRGEQKTSRPVWEYKVVEFNPTQRTSPSEIEKVLNEQGLNGWELVSNDPNFALYHFKRAK